jgi:hypothetical protein
LEGTGCPDAEIAYANYVTTSSYTGAVGPDTFSSELGASEDYALVFDTAGTDDAAIEYFSSPYTISIT